MIFLLRCEHIENCRHLSGERPALREERRTASEQLSQFRASGVFLVRHNYYSTEAVIVTSDRERLRHNGLRGRRQQPLRLRRHHTRAQIQLMFFTITTVNHAAAKSQRGRPVIDIHLCVLSKHDWETESSRPSRSRRRCHSWLFGVGWDGDICVPVCGLHALWGRHSSARAIGRARHAALTGRWAACHSANVNTSKTL